MIKQKKEVIIMQKNKFVYSIGLSVLAFTLGCLFLLLPMFSVSDSTLIYRLFLGIYGLIELGQFVVLYEKKDYTNFFVFAISAILFIASFVYDLAVPRVTSLTLLLFVGVFALAKLKKADYYHDRKSRVWSIELTLLLLFLFSGVLTCFQFLHSTDIALILGYFTIISGAIETSESFVLYLTKGKIK